jgi:hypothetical protein
MSSMKFQIYRLSSPFECLPNDEFRLTIGNKRVHTEKIGTKRTITHWARVILGTNIGYFIGDHTLESELAKLNP